MIRDRKSKSNEEIEKDWKEYIKLRRARFKKEN